MMRASNLMWIIKMLEQEQKDRIENSITLAACSTVILMPFLCGFYAYQQENGDSKNIIDKGMISSLIFGGLLGTLYATKDVICKTVSSFFASKPTVVDTSQQQQLNL